MQEEWVEDWMKEEDGGMKRRDEWKRGRRGETGG